MRVALALLLAASGCAAHSASATAAAPASVQQSGAQHSQRNVLTSEQLAAARKHSVLEAMLELRPSWFHHKGTDGCCNNRPAVFVNGQERWDWYVILNEMQAEDVAEVRYYSIVEGRVMFGTQYRNGVIAIKLRH